MQQLSLRIPGNLRVEGSLCRGLPCCRLASERCHRRNAHRFCGFLNRVRDPLLLALFQRLDLHVQQAILCVQLPNPLFQFAIADLQVGELS